MRSRSLTRWSSVRFFSTKAQASSVLDMTGNNFSSMAKWSRPRFALSMRLWAWIAVK